jgi:hypothetical protein
VLRSRHSPPSSGGGGGSGGRGGNGIQRQVSITKPPSPPPATQPIPVKVVPPPRTAIRPQHVYAPVAPMGMITLGLFSKKKKGEDGSNSDLKNMFKGNTGKMMQMAHALTQIVPSFFERNII